MKITEILHNLTLTRATSLCEQEKLTAIFLLEQEMHHIMESTHDPMAATLRLTWHRTEAAKETSNNQQPHFDLLHKHHKEFLPLLDKYFTAWEMALERAPDVTSNNIINDFIMPRANIWKISTDQMPELMSVFYLSDFLYNSPIMKMNGWDIDPKHTMHIQRELLDALVKLHNNIIPNTQATRIHNIVAWANYRLIQHLLKHKDEEKFKPSPLNPGLMQLYLLFNSFRPAPTIN